MPNLVGIHDPTASRSDLERDLSKMMNAVDMPAFTVRRTTAFGVGLACGNLLTGIEDNLSQPARDDVRGAWLMLDGEIWNVAEIRLELSRAGIDPDGKDDAGLALGMYAVHGARFYEHLNGQWNLVLHDGQRHLSLLVSDRIGSRILFYAEDGPRLAFASEAKGVIAGRKGRTRAGGVGLLQLLSSVTEVGDLTWFEGIRVLPPGTAVRLSADGRSRARYWRFRFNESGPEMSEASYADAFARRLRVATERTMKQHNTRPIAITLSGGLDSRSVALSIDRSHLPIPSLTYGDPESADVIYAAELASVIGLEHHYIEQHREDLERENARALDRILGTAASGRRGFFSLQLDRIAWRSEAMTIFSGLASMIWHPIYQRHMRIMLQGACGDALTGSHLSPELFLTPTRAALIETTRRKWLWQSDELLRLVLRPTFYRDHVGDRDAYFDTLFDGIDADEPMAIANIFDLENRQRRGAFSSYCIERYFCSCRSPFLDYELSSFLASIPGAWRFQQRIYKRMIVDHFPEARKVPWAYTRGRITKSPTYEFLREAANFSISRVARLVPRSGVKPSRWAFRDNVKLMRDDLELRRVLEEFVREDSFPSDVLDRDGVLSLVRRFFDEGEGGGIESMTAHLLGIAKCSRWFLGDSVLPIPPEADPAEFGVLPTREMVG